jgi:hypothetical protein
MKKLIGFMFFGMVAVQGMAQKLTGGDCAVKTPIREVVRSTESLALFLNQVKAGFSDDTWQAFQERAQQSPGLTAFDVFGARAEELRSSYTVIATSMEQSMLNYIAVIDPAGTRSDEMLLADFKRDMNCFVRDPAQFHLDTLLQSAGIILPDNPPGPCDEAMRNCLQQARAEYLDRAMNCLSVSGGGLLRRLISGIISGGLILVCESVAGQQHYDAFMACISTYTNCRRTAQ